MYKIRIRIMQFCFFAAHKVFAESNPEIFELWVEVVETEKEARRVIHLFDKIQIFKYCNRKIKNFGSNGAKF